MRLVYLLAAVLTTPPRGLLALPSDSIPLTPGFTWIYEGRVRWAGADGRPRTSHVRVTTRIVSTASTPMYSAALVRDWPQDLAWYAPGVSHTFSLLVALRHRLYHVSAADSSSAAAALHRLRDSGVVVAPPEAALVVDSVMTAGHLYGRDSADAPRTDTFYASYVENRCQVPAAARDGRRTSECWHVTHRTHPDQSSIDFVPGIGIVRYTYSHHGTVADTAVHLVATRTAP